MHTIHVFSDGSVIQSTLDWPILHSTIIICIYLWVTGRHKADIETETTKITRHFESMREEKTRHLLNRLDEDERMRAEDIIYEQTQEILQLSGNKVCLVGARVRACMRARVLECVRVSG